MYRIIAFAVALMAFFASCSKEKRVKKELSHQEMDVHGMPSDWKLTVSKGSPAEGRKLFVEMECYKCHEVKGEKFPGVAENEKGIGPELSQMARMHPPEFFAESIINPNAVIDPDAKKLGYVGEDGKSKMPDYNSVLTIKQVADLASYIASLKGQSSHEQMGH
jgi:mono/diheme cytochrome c family protein